jgi:PST family polysaccharide transporter
VTNVPEIESDPSQLRQRTIQSGVAAVVARTLQTLLFLGAAIAMARLLTPADFGIFAMVAPLGIIAGNIINQCVQTALLQHGDLRDPELDAFFWFIARATAGIALTMAIGGVILARFYDEPRVIGIAGAWAALLLFLVPATFQEALLKRSLRFPGVMAVQLSTLALGIAFSLLAAWRGAGYWALAVQVLVMEGARATGIFALSDWRPRMPRRSWPVGDASLRRAWLHISGVRLAVWLRDLPDLLAIGWLGGAAVLGNYSTARRWSTYPFYEPFLALTDVTLAALRRVRDDPARFTHLVSRAFLVMLTISVPAIAFVAVEARTVVRVVLGPQWDGAVPFVRLLSVAAFAIALIRVTRWIYLAQGQTRRLLVWAMLIEAPLIALAVLVGLIWGAYGVAVAVAAVSVMLILPAFVFGIRGTALSLADVLRAVARPVTSSVVAAAVLMVAGGQLPPEAGVPRLIVGASIFALVFMTVWHAIPGGWADSKALLATLGELAPARARTPPAHPGTESA